MISVPDLISKFQYAMDNDWGYIWGTSGQLWTQAAQNASTRENTVKYGSRWIGHHVVDCSGLFSWSFAQLGGYMYHGSNTMYDRYCTRKGKLINGYKNGTEPLLPGTAVFTGDATEHGHVGLFVGGNDVIEARGTQYGVVKGRLTDKKWTYWGELIGVDYSTAGQGSSEGSATKPDSRPTLKRGSKGEYVTLLQTMLINRGYDIGPFGVDGDYGRCTQAAVVSFQQDNHLDPDGVVGPKTWAALDKVPDTPAAVSYKAILIGLTKDQVTALLRDFPTADITEERG